MSRAGIGAAMFRKLIGAVVGLAMMGMAGTAKALPIQFTYSGDSGTVSGSGFMVFDDTLLIGSIVDVFQSNFIDFSFTMTNSSTSFTWGLVDLVPTSFWRFDNSTAIPDIIGMGGFISTTNSFIAASTGTISSTLGGINDSQGDWVFAGVVTAPEPSTLPLFATGLALLGFMGWRRRGHDKEPTPLRSA